MLNNKSIMLFWLCEKIVARPIAIETENQQLIMQLTIFYTSIFVNYEFRYFKRSRITLTI